MAAAFPDRASSDAACDYRLFVPSGEYSCKSLLRASGWNNCLHYGLTFFNSNPVLQHHFWNLGIASCLECIIGFNTNSKRIVRFFFLLYSFPTNFRKELWIFGILNLQLLFTAELVIPGWRSACPTTQISGVILWRANNILSYNLYRNYFSSALAVKSVSPKRQMNGQVRGWTEIPHLEWLGLYPGVQGEARCAGHSKQIPVKLQSWADTASLELFLCKDEFLNSFSGTLGTACFSSSLTVASMYFHIPGMHWQHCSHCEENLPVHILCYVCSAVSQGAWYKTAKFYVVSNQTKSLSVVFSNIQQNFQCFGTGICFPNLGMLRGGEHGLLQQ